MSVGRYVYPCFAPADTCTSVSVLHTKGKANSNSYFDTALFPILLYNRRFLCQVHFFAPGSGSTTLVAKRALFVGSVADPDPVPF
jgi:hypothetical protein